MDMFSSRKELPTYLIMTMENRLVVFILSHGRADRVETYESLKRAGYSGDLYIVCDNEDKTVDEYNKRYGKEKIIVFDKLDVAKRFDAGDNFDNRKTIFYARNACFDIAEKLGYKYFIELDDDYNIFAYKFSSNYDYIQKWILSLDDVFSAMVEYFETAGITCLAMAQNRDFIGGRDSWIAKGLNIKRKAMNTLICSTERKFEFVGRVNEDVNTYVLLGSRGKLFIQIPLVVINQQKSQKSKGGMTDVYLDSGTYLKSFYSVMYAPSSVKISLMGDKHKRIHHRINWDSAVPKILRENDA